MNKTKRLLELERADAAARAETLAACQRDVAIAEADLEAARKRLEAVEGAEMVVAGYTRPGIRRQPTIVAAANEIRDEVRQAESAADQARERCVSAEHAQAALTAIDAAIADREAQERRFKGLLGFGRPFGHDVVPLHRDLDFVIDAAIADFYCSPVLTAQVGQKTVELTAQCKADFERWRSKNEIEAYAVARVQFEIAHQGNKLLGHGAIFHRLIEDGETLDNRGRYRRFTRVDTAARRLYVPLRADAVIVGGVIELPEVVVEVLPSRKIGQIWDLGERGVI